MIELINNNFALLTGVGLGIFTGMVLALIYVMKNYS
ncbi:hypothetical protein VIAG107301_20515 [Vibrio agarivorans]